MKMKKYLIGVIFTTLAVYCFAQQNLVDSINSYKIDNQLSISIIDFNKISENPMFTKNEIEVLSNKDEILFVCNLPKVSLEKSKVDLNIFTSQISTDIFETNRKNNLTKNVFMKQKDNLDFSFQERPNKNLSLINDDFFEKNRRNIYSSMWAFASLNYLYCDLVAFMDKDLHSQYHTGEVDGMKITPEFLTGAALMMQISIANVFLPQVIKNDRTLRWVQIASGITMSLIQSATLFAGKPTPYYATFSALEIGATTFITINALKWKTNSKKKLSTESY
jgi:hypothetical protein